jgi:hypothetical protein
VRAESGERRAESGERPRYSSPQTAAQNTGREIPLYRAGGYEKEPTSRSNTRLEFRDADDDWTVIFWERNLTDERIISDQAELSSSLGLFRSTTYRPPRTFGVTIGKSF